MQLADSDILWYDARELVIEGRGWQDTEEFYDRLPARSKGVVRNPVWDLSRNSTGISVRLSTDATAVKVRWSLRHEQLALEHRPATGVSGVDLYIRTEGGRWGWLAVGRPTQCPANPFANPEAIPGSLESRVGEGDWILVKGSRRLRMERVVEALIERLRRT